MKSCLVGLVFVHIDPVSPTSHRAEIKNCVFLLETSPSVQTDVNPSRPQSEIHIYTGCVVFIVYAVELMKNCCS